MVPSLILDAIEQDGTDLDGTDLDEAGQDDAIRDEAGRDEAGLDRAGLDSAAASSRREPAGARLGVTGWLRWGWRQLTSMRTALILLFLLAAGSVPGSLLPQEGINPAAVAQYYSSHPVLARILGGLSLFNVFGAPWFAAIYLLLFASLAGCVLPRTFRLVGQARQRPPRAPRNLARLPDFKRRKLWTQDGKICIGQAAPMHPQIAAGGRLQQCSGSKIKPAARSVRNSVRRFPAGFE